MAEKSGNQYELASAYVTIMPSLKGLQDSLNEQLRAAMPSFQKNLSRGMSQAMRDASSGISRILNGSGSAFASIGRTVGSQLNNAIRRAGSLFKETLTVGARAAGTALTASIAAVSGQIAGGGFSRALGINDAESKLQALGYQGEEFSQIMQNAMKSVDGTRFTLQDSIGAAGQILAAGVKPGKELEGVLANIGKLTDMSGTRSYADISSMFGKNAAAGIVQMEDLNQLIDSGIAILPALAKQFGVTALEVRKMASDGKISFEDFNNAITNLTFDSALYAEKNVKAAFGNMRAQLSKIGADLWKPIIDGLGPIIGKITNALRALQKNAAFTDFTNLIKTSLAGLMARVEDFVTKFTQNFKSVSGVRETIQDLITRFNDFKTSIGGLSGPIAGLGVSLSSSLLSNLPVIGGLFGRISPAVGLLGGAFVTMWKSSEQLRFSIGILVEKFKALFKGVKGPGNDIFKVIGDQLSNVVDSISKAITGIDLNSIGSNINLTDILGSIFSNITDFIDTISSHGKEIGDAIGGVINSVKDAMGSMKTDSDQSFGAWLGETLVKGIQLASEALKVAVPIIAGVITAIAGIVTSDITQSILGWLVDLASYISKNKALLTTLGATLAAFFVAGKLAGPLNAMMGFFKVFGGKAAGASTSGLENVGKSIASGITGFLKSLDSIVAAIGGSFGNVLKTVGQVVKDIANLIATVIQSLAPIIKASGKILILIFKTLGKVFTSMVTALATVGQAVISGAPMLLALGAFILAIGGITWLLEKMNFFDIIGKVLTQVVDTIGQVINLLLQTASQVIGVVNQVFNSIAFALQSAWGIIEPIITWIRDSWLLVFQTIGNMILQAIPIITEAINSFIATAGKAIELSIQSVDLLLKSLAEHGLAAGLGAIGAAGGLTALATSLALLGAGTLLHDIASGLGSLWNSLVEGFTGKDNSAPAQLTALANAMTLFDGGVSSLPEKWNAVGSQAFTSGQNIMTQLSNGMTSSISTMEAAITGAITAMIQRIQASINTTPLTLNVQNPSMGNYGALNGATYNRNTNFDVTVNNSNVLTSLARSAR